MSKSAIAIVSEILGDYYYTPDVDKVSPITLGHEVLDALVASGYCVVKSPSPEDAEAHPSCWVTKVRPNPISLGSFGLPVGGAPTA